MKIYEWGDSTGWMSCIIYKNKRKLLKHIREVTHDYYEVFGDKAKAYIFEIDTIKETRKKIMTLDLK